MKPGSFRSRNSHSVHAQEHFVLFFSKQGMTIDEEEEEKQDCKGTLFYTHTHTFKKTGFIYSKSLQKVPVQSPASSSKRFSSGT